MDTHRLKYFLRIAEEGSITGAAASLGIAQPALSRQIRLLEEDLGVVLFRRTRRGVQLTDEGERLRASTAAPLRQLELAMQYAGSPLARLTRGVRLGLLDTTVEVLAAPLLSTLTAVFPKVTFYMETGSTDQLVQDMLKGAVDVAVINPVPDERVFYRDLLAEDLVVVGATTSELDPERVVTFTELVRLPLVVPRSHTGVGNLIENAALRTKVKISWRLATDSLQLTKRVIGAGLVYGVLPLSACHKEIDSNELRYAPLGEPILTQRLGIAATTNLELPREFTAKLGNIVREETSHLISAGRWAARFLSPQPWDPALA
ncbi:LysR family transcriptional regulator [Mycobacterium sp. 1554424.7]|nr:LysR family transcriptional regulator [Mycobacterium sp. 1554424.7]